ncbi:MAG: sulfotransferase [Pseudonocardia sp.]|nr:sulfotransferase [Pseudonocardia sp.]
MKGTELPEQAGAPPTINVLYIAGSGRSGSTILDRILSQYDGFFGAGELCNYFSRGLVAKRRCGCGQPIPEQCPTWAAITKEAFGDPLTIDPQRLAATSLHGVRARSIGKVLAARRAGLLSTTPEHHRAVTALYRAIWRNTGARVIVDSSKTPLYAATVAAVPGVRLHVVHLVRDARATAYSFMRKKRMPDFGDDRLMITQSPTVSARRWLVWQAVTELLWSRPSSDRYLRLRYEDVMRNPRGAVDQILALVGETPTDSPFVDDRTVRLAATHSVSGNANRFDTGTTEIRADDEWARSMRPADRRKVTVVAAPLLLRYGYPLRLHERKRS